MRAIFFVLILVHIPTFAAGPLFNGPMSAAMGGTGRAGLGSTEGAFVNPAVIPLIKSYEFVGTFRDGYKADGQHRNGWAVGVVDNSEGVFFPGSLHYARLRDTGRASGPSDGELWHIAGAYLISDRFSIGGSAYRLTHEVKTDLEDYEQWNGSIGTVILLTEDYSIAYVLDNIAKPGSDVPVGLREDMRHSIGLFARFAPSATLRFDLSKEDKFNPDNKLVYMAGLESAISEYFAFRFGFRREDAADNDIWTGGFGFNGPRLRFDYAVEKNAEGTSGALHSVDLRVPF